jgi:hypothetical protein
MASFVAVLLVLAFGHRWSATASWFTSDKTCGERHATPWFVERLGIDCDRLLRARLWKLYEANLAAYVGDGAALLNNESAMASRRVVVRRSQLPSRPGWKLGEWWPSRLVETAAEKRAGVGWQMPKKSAGRFTRPDL